MRVDVIVNKYAGRAYLDELEAAISRALFRCELAFHVPGSISEMQELILAGIEARTDAFMICGGDGTINHCLPPLMRTEARSELPPICIVPVGTANDLAEASNISKRADRAARALFEGEVAEVDVIRVRDETGSVKYMLTNGGVGFGAFTARAANEIKTWLGGLPRHARAVRSLDWLSRPMEQALQLVGTGIYQLPVVWEIGTWKFQNWQLDITLSDGRRLTTRAPIALISNQPRLAKHFLTAPFTRNHDGRVNILLVEAASGPELIRAVVDLRLGRTIAPHMCQQYEVESLVIDVPSGGSTRLLTFFGDGETLFEGARRLEIDCLHPGVKIVRMGGSEGP